MNHKLLKVLVAGMLSFATVLSVSAATDAPKPHAKYVIMYVWDGLRPDSVTQKNTPNLYQLMKNGVQFADNHASYPSFTMMNAASFATGDRAGKTGFFGNTLWHPGITGTDAMGKPVDFNQPVFTEDYKILQDLNKEELFYVDTLFNSAHKKHIATAAIGKSGPAFMQDYMAYGVTLDEKHIHPLTFAKQLQKDGFPLPKLSPIDFDNGDLVLAQDNGAPTDPDKVNMLADGVTPNAADEHGSPYNHSNEYMMKVYLDEVLTKKMTQLSVVWMRNPDTTEHNYGPGTANYRDALNSNDKMLGLILTKLKELNMDAETDIIIVSDHAHSTVSGPVDLFPLRNVKDNQVGDIDENGFSVSGEIRSAALLSEAGFHAYDGVGCVFDPVLSGIKRDKSALHQTQVDTTGAVCGKAGAKYITKAYKVPSGQLPEDAVVVAANGGSDYFYVPSHNKQVVEKVVKFLATHKQYDALFVDGMRYGKMDGTIPLATIGIQNAQGRSPDVIAGFAYNAKTKVNGMPGIEFSDAVNTRGMHGSFSPVDVHNFLMAYGPDFRKNFKDTLPSGNVDVAPTIAYILGLPFPNNDGRVLWEALSETKNKTYRWHQVEIKSAAPLKGLTTFDVVNQKTPETELTTVVYAKVLTQGVKQYSYFDRAEAVRK